MSLFKKKRSTKLRGSFRFFTAEWFRLAHTTPQRYECKLQHTMKMTARIKNTNTPCWGFICNVLTQRFTVFCFFKLGHLFRCFLYFTLLCRFYSPPRWKLLDLYLRGRTNKFDCLFLIHFCVCFFYSLLMMKTSHAWAKWAAPHMVLQPRGMSVLVNSKSTVCPRPSCGTESVLT